MLSGVERLKVDCFLFDFIKQSCLKLYPSRGIVFVLKMKTETKNNFGSPELSQVRRRNLRIFPVISALYFYRMIFLSDYGYFYTFASLHLLERG